MNDLARRVGIAALYTVAADHLLFDHPLGVGVTLFALLVAALAARRYGATLLRGGGWVALWLLLALFQTVDPTAVGVLLLVALGWAILAMSRMGIGATLFDGLVRGLSGGLRGYGLAASDLRRAVLIGKARRGGATPPLWVVLVPVAITGLFAMLLLPANMVLGHWLADGLGRAAEWLFDFRLERVLFWIALGGGVYGVMRFRLGRRVHVRESAPPADPVRRRHELTACLVTLALINALFLATNIADAIYLWGRAALPANLTYSEQAHQGAYRLILAVLLAALTLELFFRRGTRQARHRGARALANLFVVQNLVVLAGAVYRLALYADAYGLTRFRVAAAFWLALVAIGLALVAWRIARHRSLRFLLRANAASTVLVLSLWAVVNVNGVVADFNVDRHLRDPRLDLDLVYLGSLGAPALPALDRLARERDAPSAARAAAGLRQRVRAARRPWAAWSFRRAWWVRPAQGP